MIRMHDDRLALHPVRRLLQGWWALTACCLLSGGSGCIESAKAPAKPAAGSSVESTGTTAPATASADPAKTNTDGTPAKPGSTEPDAGTPSAAAPSAPEEEFITEGGQRFWRKYPDVPYVPVLKEIDGIEIPRIKQEFVDLAAQGKIPADVGNKAAQDQPGEPVDGDWLIIRFNSEPQSLNPIVESSAVQSYIASLVSDGLARQNPETLEYEPHIASRWEAEDSVKLAPDYAGYVRRVALAEGAAAAELETTVASKEEKLALRTTDGDGKPVSNAWVGLFAIGKVVGAPANGYHFWSDAEGKAEVSGLAPGKYRTIVGGELFGKTKRLDNGSLEVTPGASPNNPLVTQLEASGAKSLTLAKGEWVDVQEKTIYTYFLREDVTWSDGAPFNAHDMVFGYHVINNNAVDGDSIRVYYQDLVECSALDPHTVRMKYRQQYFRAFEFTYSLSGLVPPRHVFAKHLADEGLELVDARLTEQEETDQKKVSIHGKKFGQLFNNNTFYNEKPLGTGQYVVDKWAHSERVELVRNPKYWRSELAGHLDKLIVRFIPDSIAAYQSLKAGEIDFLWPVTPEQFFETMELPAEKPLIEKDYIKATWNVPGFGYCGWNLLNPLFQDSRVRIALSLLFDKQEFLEKKLHNAAVIVAGSQYFFGPAYDHEIKPLAYDPETARELLAEAGWLDSDNDGVLDKDGKKFEFELTFPPGNPPAEARATIMQKNYKEVGIQMNIRLYEWASFIDKVKAKNFDAVMLGWAQSLESDPYQIWHSSGAGKEARGSNHVSFNNPLADQLIEGLRLTLDDEKRHAMNFSLERILDSEQPYMFLYSPKDLGVYHKRFRGVKWYRIRPGFDLSEWYVPKDLQKRGQ